jgi:ubiquinone/menaquinone biosynthesis C-methylase UbiE
MYHDRKGQVMPANANKPFKGLGMEGWIARWYARTRSHDLEDFRRQAKKTAERLGGAGVVLEVAPGPGYFAIELSKLGSFRITGLDISRTMVEIARENAGTAGARVEFRQGNSAQMPFERESFDFVYCAAAFKNFSEPVRALDEMHRVLRPGGKAVIMDLRPNASKEEIAYAVQQSGRSAFDKWVTQQIFRRVLLKRAYTENDFIRMVNGSRFGACEVVPDSIALEIRLAKD